MLNPKIISTIVSITVVILVYTIAGPQNVINNFQNGLTELLSQSSQLFRNPSYEIDNRGNLIIHNPYSFPIQIDISGKYYTIPPNSKIVINSSELFNVSYIKIKFLNISIKLGL
ncbi:MAG: hypothetical protein QXV69_03335 [Sulfolobaceae archaeon]